MELRMKRVLCLCVAGVLLAGSVARAEEFAPDNEGFIRNWLMLAPISIPETSGGEEIDKEQIKGEGKLKPKEGDKATIDGKELVWKKIAAKDYFFDVNDILGAQTEDSVSYSVCYILADDEMKDVQLLMGSNDQGKAYLNEKEVVKFTSGRTLDKDQDVAEHLTLNKGANTLVFKVINEKNNWQGCIRFKKDGKELKNFKISLVPPAAK